MRVIKFRGKSIDTGEWVYGDLLQFFLNGEPVKTNFSILQFDYIKTSETTYETQPIGVLYDSIGQFTGLFDKNGKEIYEGDIVSKTTKNGYPDNRVGEIVFRNGLFGIKNEGCYGLPASILVSESNWVDGNASGTSIYEYEIIGNVYDNPELLNGGEV